MEARIVRVVPPKTNSVNIRRSQSWGRQMDEAIKEKIQTLLNQHRIMTIATLRPDCWPQATTVGYAILDAN